MEKTEEIWAKEGEICTLTIFTEATLDKIELTAYSIDSEEEEKEKYVIMTAMDGEGEEGDNSFQQIAFTNKKEIIMFRDALDMIIKRLWG